LAGSATLTASLLPYNIPFLTYLKEQHAAGRTLYLVTASDQRIAQAVAAHIGLFDKVIASDGLTNMSPPKKPLSYPSCSAPESLPTRETQPPI
jgi:hypothetical protein